MAVDDLYTWTDGSGTVLDFTNRDQWGILPSDGFGLSDLEVVVRETPAGHGGSWVYTRLKPKTFTMNILAKAPDWPTQQARRAALIAAFSPKKGLGTWTIYRANGTTRAIDAVIKGGLKFVAAGRKGMSRIEAIEFLAPSGRWYDPVAASGSFPFGSVTGSSNLPLNLPFTLASNNAPAIISVTNQGDWDAPVIFQISGPAVNPTITNLTTNATIRWTGTVSDGQTLVINTITSNPTVTLFDAGGFSSNVWGFLDKSSSLFAIQSGVNQLVYTQTNILLASPTYYFYHQFSGI